MNQTGILCEEIVGPTWCGCKKPKKMSTVEDTLVISKPPQSRLISKVDSNSGAIGGEPVATAQDNGKIQISSDNSDTTVTTTDVAETKIAEKSGGFVSRSCSPIGVLTSSSTAFKPVEPKSPGEVVVVAPLKPLPAVISQQPIVTKSTVVESPRPRVTKNVPIELQKTPKKSSLAPTPVEVDDDKLHDQMFHRWIANGRQDDMRRSTALLFHSDLPAPPHNPNSRRGPKSIEK